MFQKYFIFSMSVAAMASFLAAMYMFVYFKYLFDFSSILPYWKVISVYFSLSLFLAGIYFVVQTKLSKEKTVFVSILVSLIAFASILIPITRMGVFVENAEFYAGFAIPLHFILPMSWLATAPYFLK